MLSVIHTGKQIKIKEKFYFDIHVFWEKYRSNFPAEFNEDIWKVWDLWQSLKSQTGRFYIQCSFLFELGNNFHNSWWLPVCNTCIENH